MVPPRGRAREREGGVAHSTIENGTTADPLGLVARVLYRDDDLIVLDKPAGIPVHAGPKGGIVLMDGLDALRFGAERRPELAHRLDKDTSGCLVLGRTGPSLAAIGKLFAAGRIAKTYWAVVRGLPEADAGRIDAPLAKRDQNRGWWMMVDPKGSPAVTEWRVLGRGPGLAWLELRPLTGRTHQLRAHTAHVGLPILGDPIYGRSPANGPRLHLHARAVTIPARGRRLEIAVVAPAPPHMQDALAACGWSERPATS